MSNNIIAQNIEGLVIYGQQQVDYTVNGDSHQSYGQAVAYAALYRAASVEFSTSALQTPIRMRMKKVEELGTVLAAAATGMSNLATEDMDDSFSSKDLATAYDILVKYNLDRHGLSVIQIITDQRIGIITKENLMKLQNDVQYEMDREDNKLQQDMVAIQSYISKRDQAYSLAASIVRKVNKTASHTINGIH